MAKYWLKVFLPSGFDKKRNNLSKANCKQAEAMPGAAGEHASCLQV